MISTRLTGCSVDYNTFMHTKASRADDSSQVEQSFHNLASADCLTDGIPLHCPQASEWHLVCLPMFDPVCLQISHYPIRMHTIFQQD